MGIYQRLFGDEEETRSESVDLGDVGDVWRSGGYIGPDEALGIPAVWRGVNLIANTVAGLPLRIYRQDGDGVKTRDRSHPADGLLNRWSDPGTPAYNLRRAMTVDALLTGNGFSEVRRSSSGRPVYLRYLPPNQVQFKVENGRRFYELVKTDGAPERLAYADVVHIPSLISADGWSGIGFVDAGQDVLQTIKATAKFTKQHFDNSGRPSIIVKQQTSKKPEIQKQIKEGWNNFWRSGSGLPAIVDPETEVQELGTGEGALSALDGLGIRT